MDPIFEEAADRLAELARRSPEVEAALGVVFLALRRTGERLERARAVLAEVEWTEYADGGWCPSCDSHQSDGHKPDCELKALIGPSRP